MPTRVRRRRVLKRAVETVETSVPTGGTLSRAFRTTIGRDLRRGGYVRAQVVHPVSRLLPRCPGGTSLAKSPLSSAAARTGLHRGVEEHFHTPAFMLPALNAPSRRKPGGEMQPSGRSHPKESRQQVASRYTLAFTIRCHLPPTAVVPRSGGSARIETDAAEPGGSGTANGQEEGLRTRDSGKYPVPDHGPSPSYIRHAVLWRHLFAALARLRPSVWYQDCQGPPRAHIP